MKRQLSCWALCACIATGTLVLAGCSTVGSRIEANRTSFDQLSSKDRALVSQGNIGPGMSQQAVYMAWGQPQQKATGIVHGHSVETWVYTYLTSAYPGYGYGGYGPYGYGGFGYGLGFAGPVGFYGRRGGHRFYGASIYPYWNPYYYPFPATVSYPVKTVSFERGRVVAFQYLVPSAY